MLLLTFVGKISKMGVTPRSKHPVNVTTQQLIYGETTNQIT